MDKNEQNHKEHMELKLEIVQVKEQLKAVRERLEDLINAVQINYVSQAEFRPVKSICYGFVAVTCLTVVGSLLALVLK